MDENLRRYVIQRRRDGMSVGEIAGELEMSSRAVKRAIYGDRAFGPGRPTRSRLIKRTAQRKEPKDG